MHLHYIQNAQDIEIVVHNGEARSKYSEEDIVKSATYAVADLPEAFSAGDGEKTLASYGLLKLMQDRTSQDKGHVEKFDAMAKFFEFLKGGEWKQAVERTGGGGSRRKIDAVLAQAVAELKGISPAQASQALAGLDKEQYEALAANEAVAAKVQELKDAAGEDTADLSDLL